MSKHELALTAAAVALAVSAAWWTFIKEVNFISWSAMAICLGIGSIFGLLRLPGTRSSIKERLGGLLCWVLGLPALFCAASMLLFGWAMNRDSPGPLQDFFGQVGTVFLIYASIPASICIGLWFLQHILLAKKIPWYEVQPDSLGKLQERHGLSDFPPLNANSIVAENMPAQNPDLEAERVANKFSAASLSAYIVAALVTYIFSWAFKPRNDSGTCAVVDRLGWIALGSPIFYCLVVAGVFLAAIGIVKKRTLIGVLACILNFLPLTVPFCGYLSEFVDYLLLL